MKFFGIITFWIVFCVVVLVSFSKPANGAETCYYNYSAPTVAESLCWPVESNIVVIESPYRNIWGIRQFARELSNDLNLTFMWYRGVQCEDFPTATCIHVYKTYTDSYGGYTVILPNETVRHLVLDKNYEHNPDLRSFRRYVGRHEFFHALGLSHHQGSGLMSDVYYSNWPYYGEELALLRRTYN